MQISSLTLIFAARKATTAASTHRMLHQPAIEVHAEGDLQRQGAEDDLLLLRCRRVC